MSRRSVYSTWEVSHQLSKWNWTWCPAPAVHPQEWENLLSLEFTTHSHCSVLYFIKFSTNHFNCLLLVNCKVGEWTEWGPCLQKVNTEGYKKGEESRTRQVLQSSGPDGHPCPHVIEVRKCAIKDTESLINEFLKLQRQWSFFFKCSCYMWCYCKMKYVKTY